MENKISMLLSHLKLALRSLFRYKMHSLISVLGLAVGFACFIIVFVFIAHEMSYDTFPEDAEWLYRVRSDTIEKRTGFRYNYATIWHSMAPLLKDDFPEIEDIVRIRRYRASWSVHYQDKHFLEDQVYFADPMFFEFFSFPLIEGNAQTVLEAPYSIVLTEQTASKYFGSDSPVGKTLHIGLDSNSTREYLVTGVVQDLPPNTHFKFDFVASIKEWKLRRNMNDSLYHTYLRLAEGASPEVLENKFPEFLERHNYNLEEWERQLFLQPLQDIHLYSHFEYELSPNRDIRYLYFLVGIALVILLIVCINYINFSTFRFTQRAKEVGLRKALGSVQSQLVQQFLGETLLLTFFAFLVSLVLVLCSWPYVSRFIGPDVEIDVFRLAIEYGLWLFAAIVCIGLIAGLYPAFFLAKFNPSATLGGYSQSGGTASFLRRTLIIFQFVLSIVLIITTLALRHQLAFMRSQDLGFDREQVVVIPAKILQPTSIAEYLQDPRILNISGTFGSPGVSDNSGRFIPEGQDDVSINTIDVGYTYLETMGLELIAGRSFSRDFSSDEHEAFIINESAAKFLGWENPVGKRLERTSMPQRRSASSKIIGVVKDFHYQSLHHSIEPLVIGLRWNMQNVLTIKHLTVRIDPRDLSGALAFLEAKTHEFVPNEPFQYYFLDEVFDQFYREEEQLSRLIGFFSTLSIVIICLGVLGLASFSVEQRTKEIGIRKVLGASSSGLVYLLMKPVLVWLVVANLIAWPVAYVTNQAWLQHFAYRIDTVGWEFLLGSLIQALTVIGTVVLQTSKAVQTNPVQTLRSE